MPQLDTRGTHDKQPENYDKRQVKAAKSSGIKHRKRKVECSACCDQPYLVAVPYRPYSTYQGGALLGISSDKVMNDTRTYVEPVEDDITNQHKRNYYEPNCFHIVLLNSLPRFRPYSIRPLHARSGAGSGKYKAARAKCTYRKSQAV